MAWSDAAREASAEARRASAKAKKEPTVANHEAASRAHTTAENAHANHPDSDTKDSHTTARVFHDKMSAEHQIAAEKLRKDPIIQRENAGKSDTERAASATKEANSMTAAAKASGSSPSHEEAADAHRRAADAHTSAFHDKSIGTLHHEKMASLHDKLAETIRKDPAKMFTKGREKIKEPR